VSWQDLPSSQATYHGLKKPKEAFHDADLYRLYHKVGDEIEGRGGRLLRIQLDYEMKQELYARLARASQDKSQDPGTLRKEIAERYHVKVVSGKIPIPDLLEFFQCLPPSQDVLVNAVHQRAIQIK